VLLFVAWNRRLARRVWERTSDLERSKQSLEAEIAERRRAEQEIYDRQKRLRALAWQLTIAEERERRRIAADLHDHVGQSLALARLQLAAARKSATDDRQAAVLDDLSESMLKAVQDIRHLIFELSSPSMNEIGLGAAISEWLEEKVGNRHGLETEFIDHIPDSKRRSLDDDVRAVLFRNVRELLANVVKHAQAKKVTVRLELANTDVHLSVEDDGVGFDATDSARGLQRDGAFGLFSIRERMGDLGGSLEIVSEPGKGCRATLTVPSEVG
jgi:signal transduction histidine kinase